MFAAAIAISQRCTLEACYTIMQENHLPESTYLQRCKSLYAATPETKGKSWIILSPLLYFLTMKSNKPFTERKSYLRHVASNTTAPARYSRKLSRRTWAQMKRESRRSN